KGISVLQIKTSGWIPMLLSSFTLCWVGLVFSSPALDKYGTKVTWIYITFSLPTSYLICLMASKKGRESISPTVPPISVITTSISLSLEALIILSLISFVIWGITCTVPPLYSPFLSLLSTVQ